MPFPNAEQAVIAEEKIRGYLLNPSHPVGGSKAVWFASIGYTMGNWQELASDLLQLAQTSEDFVAKSSPFGVNTKSRVSSNARGTDPRWCFLCNRPRAP